MGYGYKELLSSLQYIHDVCKEHPNCDGCPLAKEKRLLDGTINIARCRIRKSTPDTWEVEEWLG